MRLIDEQYTRTPFYGSRRMTIWLKGIGDAVNRKRVLGVRYGDIYIKEYGTVCELEGGIEHYFRLYNRERPHQTLGYQSPARMYLEELAAMQRLAGRENRSQCI